MVPSKRNQIFEEDVNEEAALIKNAQANPAAFAELYQRYLDRIYLYLHTRVTSDEDAALLTCHPLSAILSLEHMFNSRVFMGSVINRSHG